MFKKALAVVMLAVMACVAIVPVSADYADMLDYGIGYATSNTGQITYVGAGETLNDWYRQMCFWALDWFEKDYTYTFTFKTDLSPVKDDWLPSLGTCGTFNSKPLMYNNIKAVTTALKQVRREGESFYFTVKFNPGLESTLPSKPLYMVLHWDTSGNNGAKLLTNAWSVSVEYDPGGSKYTQELVDLVAQIKDDNQNYHDNAIQALDAIKGSVDSVPGKIGEVLEQHDEKNKQEANTEGNDNINQATSALTNALPVASISDAVAPLVTACGYNGITSVWSFPAMKIPAIAGLFDEIQLNEVQNFDLCSYADQYIPDELLTLIRSITTVLLIVWAIREIMSLLSSLLGGGNSVGSG